MRKARAIFFMCEKSMGGARIRRGSARVMTGEKSLITLKSGFLYARACDSSLTTVVSMAGPRACVGGWC